MERIIEDHKLTDKLTLSLNTNTSTSIALIGEWGSGKTFYWKRFIEKFDEDNQQDSQPKIGDFFQADYNLPPVLNANSLIVFCFEFLCAIALLSIRFIIFLVSILCSLSLLLLEIIGFKKEKTNKNDFIPSGYVSCYNIENYNELRERVLSAAVSAKAKSILKSNRNNVLLSKFFTLFSLLPLNLKKGLLTLDYSLLPDNWIIAIDDIERLPLSIELSQVFGYITYLRDECNLKVIVLLNEAGLKDDTNKEDREDREAILKNHKDKAIEHSIDFKLSPGEVKNLILTNLPELSLYKEAIYEKCNLLKLSNVRILLFFEKRFAEVYKKLKECNPDIKPDDDFIKAVISSLLLFCWVRAPEKGGSLDNITEKNLLDKIPDFFPFVQKDLSNEKNELNSVIHQHYGAYTTKKYIIKFSFLLEFANSSFLPEKELRKAYHESVENIRAEALRTAPTKVWEKYYHSSFKGNPKDFVAELEKAVSKSIKYISIDEMSQHLSVIEEFGDKIQEENLIRKYLKTNQDSISSMLQITDNDSIKNESFRKAIENHIENFIPQVAKLSIIETMETIFNRYGYKSNNPLNHDERESLNQFSEDEMFNYFDSTEKMGILIFLRNLPERSIASKDLCEKLKNVKKRLSTQSELNKFRLK